MILSDSGWKVVRESRSYFEMSREVKFHPATPADVISNFVKDENSKPKRGQVDYVGVHVNDPYTVVGRMVCDSGD